MKRLGWWIMMSALGAGAARGQEEAQRETTPALKEALQTAPDNAAGETEHQVKTKVADEAVTMAAPDWVRDAQWYYIEVPLFRNGDTVNDQPRTLAWGRVPTVEETLSQDTSENLYGGDLQGLRRKLPYLKDLGINALILGGVFPDASREGSHDGQIPKTHVRTDIAAGENENRPDELNHVEEVSAGDRLFRDFLKEAHAQGFRVVVQLPLLWRKLPPGASGIGPMPWLDDMMPFVVDMSQRWLQRTDESEARGGIDGWWVHAGPPDARAAFRNWRGHIRSNFPKCALLAVNQPVEIEYPLQSGLHVDGFVHSQPIEPIIRFFEGRGAKSAGEFLAFMSQLRIREKEWLYPCGDGDRWLRCLAGPDQADPGNKREIAAEVVTPEVVNGWRLTATLIWFSLDGYALTYGDEVGFYNDGPPFFREPMWWADLENPESKRPTYRGDFYALIQMLNVFRARFAPLRRGDFKPVLTDDEKKLLAFSRSLPGDEVILVMNYGDAKQPVKLTVAKPGDLIPILSPQLKPMPIPRKGQPPPPEPDLTKIPTLRVGGQREYVKPDGTIDFWVDPMGIRIVLIGESANVQKK